VIELNQSWAGPYHRMPLARWMLVHPITGTEEPKADPYPPDVLAACPMAREWGVVLYQHFREFGWCAENERTWWSATKGWVGHMVVWSDRAKALANPPTCPPPGYVAAKPALLDELAEVAWRGGTGLKEDAHKWDNEGVGSKDFYRRAALSVARRLLEKGPTPEEIDKACDAYLLVKGQGDGVRVNLGRMVDALQASRRAQLAELEGKV